MKLKASIKYQLITVGKSFLIFYGIVMVMRGIGIMYALMGDGKLGMAGTEVNSAIFMGFLGAFTFLEDFRFLIQNGYSRKTMLLSFLVEFCVAASIFALSDMVFEALTNGGFGYRSLFTQLYGTQNIVYQFLWCFLLNLFAGVVAFFTTVLLARLNKQQKMVFFAIPVIIVMLVSLLEVQVTDGAIMEWVFERLQWLFGFTVQGVHYTNPIIFFIAGAGMFYAFAYLATRRAPVKG